MIGRGIDFGFRWTAPIFARVARKRDGSSLPGQYIRQDSLQVLAINEII